METKQLQVSKSGDVSVEFVYSEALERYDALALEALDECRKSIMMALRYLNSALWRLPFERMPLTRTLSTGGKTLRYDPENVIDRFRSDPVELTRDCIHSVLHYVFHHPFDERHEEFDAWSLACDIAVEICAIELCGTRFPSASDEARLEAAERLSGIARNLTAPCLYQVLRCGGPGESLHADYGLTRADISELTNLFKRDAHDRWASRPREDAPDEEQDPDEPVPDLQKAEVRDDLVSLDGGQGAGEAHGDEAEGSSEDDRQSDEDDITPDPSDSEPGQDGQRESPPEDDREDLEEWERVSKQVEAEMRAHIQRSRSGNGSMLLNLSVANRKPPNYDEFLRRFATVAEDIRVNDDEFDYIFYTYGLDHYGNIPLVEPLEYKESERVREFVIAIDTSESCSGELVRTFVERTYDILRQKTNFGDEINVHLIQCDFEVRAATKVTSLEQLEEYSDSFWVRGGGGTDFKPVFEYVDKLVEAGEFRDLRGLIYFTDGYGSFPVKAPDYDVAFVFIDAEGVNVRVPAWAMKVVMTREDVMERG